MAPLEMSMSSLLVYMNGWECVRVSDDLIEIKTPNLQVREILEKLGYTTPAHLNLEAMRKELLEGVPMPRTPYVARKHRNKAKENVPISPEEKREARENEQRERERRNSEEKARRKAEKEAAKIQKQNAGETSVKSQKESTSRPLQNNESAIETKDSKKKPGVPKGYKRGPYNKDGSLRKKPGPKPGRLHA